MYTKQENTVHKFNYESSSKICKALLVASQKSSLQIGYSLLKFVTGFQPVMYCLQARNVIGNILYHEWNKCKIGSRKLSTYLNTYGPIIFYSF